MQNAVHCIADSYKRAESWARAHGDAEAPYQKTALKPFTTLLLDVGAAPRRLLALRRFPRYLRDAMRFRRLGGRSDSRYVIFSDYDAQAGSATMHYFHQGLLVAQFIHQRNPHTHIDIGSRIDGFVARVAAVRKITVMDVRALDDCDHPNISFLQADLMDASNSPANIADSISCLHAIEHFGLGRYGDPHDPRGHIAGFHNILRMLRPGGTLYISFPIAARAQVCFNAHRIFHPRDILQWPGVKDGLHLERFDYADDAGHLHLAARVDATPPDLRYGCGIDTFRKPCWAAGQPRRVVLSRGCTTMNDSGKSAGTFGRGSEHVLPRRRSCVKDY